MDKPPYNIQASDHQLAEIVQGMNEACFALDSRWRFTFVNDRCQSLLHHSRDEMLGRSIWKLFHKLAGTPVEEHCRRAMAERVPVSYETFSPIAGRWIDVRVFPSGDGLAVFLLDIHERKLAGQALRESEDRFQMMSASIEDVLYSVDGATGEFQYVNPAFERLLGYSLDDVAAMGGREEFLEQVIQEGGFAVQREMFHQLRSSRCTQAPARWVAWWLCKNGTLRCFEDCWIPLYTGDVLTSTFGVLRDITERKEAEDALENASRLNRQIVSGAKEGIIVYGSDLRYQVWNPFMEELTGYPAMEVIGRHPAEVFPFLKEAGVMDQLERVLAGESCATREFPFHVPRTGRSGWVSDTNSPLRNGNGEIIGVIGIVTDITGRKRANQALRESEEEFRAMFDVASVGMAQADPDTGRWLRVNRRMCVITGYTAGELLEKRISDLTHPADRKRDWEAFQRVVRGEAPEYRMEKRYIRKDQSVVWVNVNMTVIRDAGGKPVRTMAAIEDITERKRAEEALRESEQRYRQLVHGLPAAVYACDAQGRITLYNAAAVRLWGREPKTGSDRWGCAHRLYTPDGKRVFRTNSPVAMTVRNGEPIRGAELIVERKDGSRSHVMAFPDPVHDSSGAVIGVVNMLVDITELKAVENSLRNSERTLRKLSRAVEQSPASVVITNSTGEIDYVNPKFTELTGYSVEEVLGKNPRILKSGHQAPEVYADMWATITSGHDWHGELCNRKKNGELYWESAVIAPILDENGRVSHFLALKEDITERRRTQMALRESERCERERASELAALLDAMPAPVFISYDPECLHVVGNRAADELLRVPRGAETSLTAPEETRPRHFRAVKDGRDLDNDEMPVQRAARGLPVHGYEFAFVFDDGSSRDVLSYGTTLWDEMGRPRGAAVVMIDITERRRLEREILEISECEQSRLGQDLHDGLGQELAGIAMLCKVLADELQQDSHPSAKAAADISAYVNNTIGSARRLARGLYPIDLRRYGLFAALGELAEQTGTRLGIRCELSQTGVAPEFGESVGIHIYRIVQESIGNAIKHGRARRILIESVAGDGFHTFTVTDDGVGFEKPADNGGMGLHLMEYRARVIDAKITVEKPGQGGCRVTCTVPV